MPYDERLAARVREALAPEGPSDERAMFGGLAFMVGGHMAVCVSGQGGLMVRVAGADRAALVEQAHVEPMVMGGRTSRTWLRVHAPAVAGDDDLAAWVARGVGVVRGLGPRA